MLASRNYMYGRASYVTAAEFVKEKYNLTYNPENENTGLLELAIGLSANFDSDFGARWNDSFYLHQPIQDMSRLQLERKLSKLDTTA